MFVHSTDSVDGLLHGFNSSLKSNLGTVMKNQTYESIKKVIAIYKESYEKLSKLMTKL